MTAQFILDVDKQTSIVFGGITWKPLIGSNLAGQSEKSAVSAKATHFVAAGKHSAAVGTTKLDSERVKEKGRKFYSAAAVFAQAHQSGIIVTTLGMADGRVWVVAAHDGVILSDTDVLLSLEDSVALVTEIKGRHKQAVVISGDFETQQYLNSKSLLAPVRSGLDKVPTGLKVGLAILVCLLIADTSYDQYKKYKRNQARALENEQTFDAHAEWKIVLDQWAASIQIDGEAGLKKILNELGQTPMTINGWKLAEVNCAAVISGWSCKARYEASINTSNMGFKMGKPNSWVAKWDGLTNAVGEWTIPVSRIEFDRAHLKDVSDFSVQYISRLQRTLPAFSNVELSPPSLVNITQPQVFVKTEQGSNMVPVPYPEDNSGGIELPKTQTFKVVGPLRSFVVLPLINETALKKMRFVVEGLGSAPTLRSSMFTAELTGEFYVR